MSAESTNIKFGQLIKNVRKEMKMTQSQFAELIGKNQNTVSYYEKDQHFPKGTEIIMLATKIKIQPSTIVEAIDFSRRGIIAEHEEFFIDIDKLDNELLRQKYKLRLNGEELTEDELEEALELIRYKRFKKQNDR